MDISFDLETLGTTPDAHIRAIGAALFDRDTGEMGPTFYRRLEWSETDQRGRAISPSTVRLELIEPDADDIPLAAALEELTHWLMVRTAGKSFQVWGNGSTFDISILEHAYRQLALPVPWNFWEVRDMRTLVDAAEMMGFIRAQVRREGEHHTALADAIYQAKVISMAWRILTDQLPPEAIE